MSVLLLLLLLLLLLFSALIKAADGIVENVAMSSTLLLTEHFHVVAVVIHRSQIHQPA